MRRDIRVRWRVGTLIATVIATMSPSIVIAGPVQAQGGRLPSIGVVDFSAPAALPLFKSNRDALVAAKTTLGVAAADTGYFGVENGMPFPFKCIDRS